MKFPYKVIKLFSSLFKKGADFVPKNFLREEIYRLPDFKIELIDGKTISVHNFKGKKLVIVNTASKCGFTPQYDELENLYRKNKEKLIIIAFPCNQFGKQEPGSAEEVHQFCKKNYNITFPVAGKTEVIGKNPHELYQWLSDASKNGWNSKAPSWNFCKYAIDENGFLTEFHLPHSLPKV